MKIQFVMSSAKEYDKLNKKLGKKRRASKNDWLCGFVGWGEGWRQLHNRTVVVGLREVRGASRDMKISFVRLLNRVVDHELAHAFVPPWKEKDTEKEIFAIRFERAGDWARNEG